MSRPTRVWITVIGLVVLLVFIGPFIFGVLASVPNYEQPIVEFSHKRHVQNAGIDCLYCHSGATRSPVSGIPSVEKCMGCHEHVLSGEAPIVKLQEYWENGEPISWTRVYQLPRYVHYPHHVHVSAGLNCETCHGNVGEMDIVTPAQIPNMGWCIRCHQGEENAVELMDCLNCHY
ncbi:MAG: cytochrome c3 family protein [Anaerolineae bacterium]|nr:cytochrome c3 family protein [Anaerolineae bacterium]